LITIIFLVFRTVLAQDTFSIVAIDSVTGEIGSAGASCVGYTGTYPHGAQIISDLHPGIGAIHTQAYWLSANQQNARTRMLAGDAPQQIIDWLVQNDAQSNPLIRQYGIVDYNNGHPRSAAYTGANCQAWKGHTAGISYAIQGNILLGQHILDSMQSRFLSTPGPLALKLMAALQGAKTIGADSRCASPYQSSSLSAFVRVARPTDTQGNFYLDLWMSYPQNWSGAVPQDPIDSLQLMFDQWLVSTGQQESTVHGAALVLKQLENGSLKVDFQGSACRDGIRIQMFDSLGRLLLDMPVEAASGLVTPYYNLPRGVCFYSVFGLGDCKGSGIILIR